MSKLPDWMKLNPTRVFLLVLVALALTFAVGTVVSSLGVWRQNDAITSTSTP